MNHPVLVAFSVGCLLVAGGAFQDPPESRPTIPEATQKANKKIVSRMQGAWRLVDMQLVDQKLPRVTEGGIKHVGYCLISGSYLSIDLHLGIAGGNSQVVARSFVSSMHRFELDANSRMETATVIGTSVDLDGKPVFEPPNTKRRYGVDVAGDRLTLRREDGHTLVFERMLDDRTRFDVYGRPLQEPADDAEPKKDATGEKAPPPKEGGG